VSILSAYRPEFNLRDCRVANADIYSVVSSHGITIVDSLPFLILNGGASQVFTFYFPGFAYLPLKLPVNPLPKVRAKLVKRISRRAKVKQFSCKRFGIGAKNSFLYHMRIERSLKFVNDRRNHLTGYIPHCRFPLLIRIGFYHVRSRWRDTHPFATF
jgi:hypothetical protein